MNSCVGTTATVLLAEYSGDHRHPFNRSMHSICVPVITIAVIGLLAAIPVPAVPPAYRPWLNFGTAALAFLVVYYLVLAPRLGIGMLIAALFVAPLIAQAATLATPLWLVSTVAFVVGWIGQFAGHYVEGRRPSFFRDLRFLLIGPLWVLEKLYHALHIRA